jgi:outer membrane protein assembly factor BamB
LLSIVPLSALADNWPQWRGPERTGVSEETGLLQQWPAEGPKLVWQVREIGQGYSTPAVVGDRLYLLSSDGTDNEFVQALRAADGSQIWSARLGSVGNPDQNPSYPGARSTPTVDGDVLYALGSNGDLACVAIADGEIRWQKNLRSEFAGAPGRWAYSESPLVDGDVLVCTPGGSDATIVALRKTTGETIWKCPIEGGEAAYASLIAVEVDGVKQYVQFLADGVGLVGVEAETGKLLWRYERTAEGSPANIPTPVADGGYVYSAASRSGGGLVQLKKNQDSVDAEQVYFSPDLPKAIGGTVLLGDYLYGSNGDVLMCVEFATGEVQWQERIGTAASLCFADGSLYLHGENGEVLLVEATPEAYREKGRFTPPNRPEREGRAWTYPVVADGRLYLRDWNSLWCYDVAAQ